MSVPSIPRLLVSHWELSWWLDVAALLAAGIYVWSSRRVRRGWPVRRTLFFVAGLVSILVGLQSGIGAFDDELLSVHMVQHLILLVVAPVLLLAGRPVELALQASSRAGRRRIARLLPGARRLTAPIGCLAVYFVVVLGTHVPAFYDATLTQPLLHDAEHGLFLLSGMLLWWPVIGGDLAASHRLNGVHQLVYLIVAMLPMELIGAFLSRQPTLFYPAYATPAHSLGISAVIDQQHAGAIMWVAGGTLMIAIVLWTAMRALIDEERRQQAREMYSRPPYGPQPPATVGSHDSRPGVRAR